MDDATTSSYFPQAGRKSSSDPAVQSMYWRCVAVFFATARLACGPRQALRLYTDSYLHVTNSLPAVGALLQELGVETVVVPRQHVPPSGYYRSWNNQFYILDILQRMSSETDDRRYLVLDSDCLCLRPLDEMFETIEHNGALLYDTGELPGRDINGLTREQLGCLFAEMSGKTPPTPPIYFGGEIVGITSGFLRRLYPLAESAWQESLRRHSTNQLKFNEEAHLLTYVYFLLGLTSDNASRYIKRLWTGIHFRNGQDDDRNLPIIHVPGEKRFGFLELYAAVANPESWFYHETNRALWVARIQKIMSIPRPTLRKLLCEFSTYAMARLTAK
ncbi:MAG: hypothetical protein P4M01_10420 [Acidobacteriota bacterium]|nr:hypothetical protein [Acidobacteriota bacterium]